MKLKRAVNLLNDEFLLKKSRLVFYFLNEMKVLNF